MASNDQLDDHDLEGSYALYKEYKDILTSRYLQSWIIRYSDEKHQKVLYYLYTFTLKPDADSKKAEEYIKSIAKRKANLNLVELAYCVEHAESNKHFHVMIGATRSIRTDAFKQYSQIYGKINRSRKVSEESIQIVDYLTKESDIIYLIKP